MHHSGNGVTDTTTVRRHRLSRPLRRLKEIVAHSDSPIGAASAQSAQLVLDVTELEEQSDICIEILTNARRTQHE